MVTHAVDKTFAMVFPISKMLFILS